jgi:hypothetical protein
VGPPFTLGKFKKEKSTLTFIASGDYKSALSLPVMIPAPKAEQFDPVERQWKELATQAKNGKSYATLHLEPGGAALLRW